MEINYQYLSQLKYPHYAITSEYWDKLRTELFFKVSNDDRFKNINSLGVPELARRLGLVWPLKRDEKLSELLKTSIDQIVERSHVSEDWKKAFVMLLVKLNYSDEDTIDRISVIVTANDLAEAEKKEVYSLIRPLIRNKFRDMLADLTNENYEEKLQILFKSIFATIITSCKYKTKDPKRYIDLMLARLFDRMSYKEIEEKFDVQGMYLSTIMQRFIYDFKEIFEDHEEMTKLVAIYERIENLLFDELEVPNGDDYVARNERLWKLTGFRDLFIGENLKEWVD